MYVIGGFGPGAFGPVGAVEAYNPATNSWTQKAPMPVPLNNPNGIGVINGKFFVAGGWKEDDASPSGGLREYTPATDHWRKLGPDPILSGSGAVGVIGGKLYVFNGTQGGGGRAGQLSRYDPATNTWTSLRRALHDHMRGGGGVIGGKFYVVGGLDEFTGNKGHFLEVYDPSTNWWTGKAPMPTAREDVASVVLMGKLYVIGGFKIDPNGIALGLTATVEVYDPATNTWSTGVPMPKPMRALGAAAVTNSAGQAVAYVIGGVGCCGLSNQNLLYDPTVPNQPPVAVANGPYTGTVGQPVQFSALGSSDPEGAWNGTWSFGDGMSYTGTFGNFSSQNPQHTYTAAGGYPVTFTVTDANGAATTASTTATISP
ncbi:MAG TPA: PKD domain-containing protein [Gemmatimonadales bacterium]|nr:PKD domain-containing protein [Gemmatimonadales bacterium]